ncbi:MAG: M23 family metallopeptidase [Clostridia bacterium]
MTKKYYSRISLIFFSLILITMVSISVILTILNIYRPVYKVTIGKEDIGYFRTKQDFDEMFYVLTKNMQETGSANFTYLDIEPKFELQYVKYDKIDSDNSYEILKSQIKVEYEVYNLKVNEEKKFTFEDYEDAEKYANEIKKQVNTLNMKIEPEKIKDKADTVLNTEKANAIYKEIVSRYKPVVIEKPKPKPKPKPVVSYPKPSKEIQNNKVYIENIAGGVWPTTSRKISCYYGGYRGHKAIDIDGKTGDPNFAYKSGKIVFAGYSGAYGYMVKIDHGNGFQTLYAHNSKLLVSVGQEVEGGQTIALQGNTGNSSGDHLHFEIRINGRAVNPLSYM